MTWNVEGLGSVKRLMPINILTSDIIILTETFNTCETSLQGYYTYETLATKGNMGRPSGGITCLIKPLLSPAQLIHSTPNVIVINANNLVIIGAYFQPERTAQEIIETLGEAFQKIDKNKAVILAGDLNCRIDQHNHKSDTVINYLTNVGLCITNKPEDKTYIGHNGTSTIDLILHNALINTTNAKTMENTSITPIRKHIPVCIKMMWENVQKKTIKNLSKTKKRLDTNVLAEIADKTKNRAQKEIENGNINEAAQILENIVKKSQIVNYVSERKSQPWFDRECYDERKEVLKSLHRARTSLNSEDLKLYNGKRRQYKKLLREKKGVSS
ncbi:hypothetical protein L9F63_006445 [Diploptera punctata]|uniref:Endonuclease/exonuclease/phosphatase domain-containing protein n=1 Tax=Diploptera punctata TaxID=6984 RepID=A0AAD7ZAL8_DIPPU|nr:hypothetical protein L9F63_006445 [Diploptera punctata]